MHRFVLSFLEKFHLLVYSDSYMESAKVRPSDFTRRRKMSFVQYILFILEKSGRSLQAALNTFFASMKGANSEYSKQSFSKGRLRIKPEAIRALFDFTVNEFYTNAPFSTFMGYRVLAIDGTRLNLPNTTELAGEYGIQTSQGPAQVQALVSCLYDVVNKLFVDIRFSPCKTSERADAADMIRALGNQCTVKNLILMDRGYPSAELLHQLDSENHAYVIRCCTEFVRGMKLRGDDCIIEHRFAKAKNHPVKLRIVTVVLQNGKKEILATNLYSEDITREKLAQIYQLRWGIETQYDTIKNKLSVENFSGTGKIAVLQDFYATMTLWNLTGIIALDVKDEIEAQHNSIENQYAYQLNISMTISVLKEQMINLVMCGSKFKSGRILRKIVKALRRSVVPVRPNRSFERKRKHIALKFHNNNKVI